jgi:hypothetical protein
MKRSRIEAVPKRVEIVTLADGTFPVKPGIDPAPFADAIAFVRRCIVTGTGLPERFYGRSAGRDLLLDDEGWLHLHIGVGIDDDVLMIVEQTEDRVIFIALTDHTIFAERPRRRSLKALRSKIARLKTR